MPLAEKKNILINNKSNQKLQANFENNNLSEILVILLDNAIKYSPNKSTITITSSTNNKNSEITIKDQGIGIKKADLGHIFNRFYQVDTARSSQAQKGHGLGLSIAKQLALKMGGDIKASSTLGKGSSFTVKLS